MSALVQELREAAKVRRDGNPYALRTELLERAADAIEAAPDTWEVAEQIARAIEPKSPIAGSVDRIHALTTAASVARSIFPRPQ